MPSDGQMGASAAPRPINDSLARASAAIDTLSAVQLFRESDAETRELIRQIIANNERLDRVRARQQWWWLVVGAVISCAGLIGGLALAFTSHQAAGALVTIAVLVGLASALLRRGDAGFKTG
jgi:hypothetical protein